MRFFSDPPRSMGQPHQIFIVARVGLRDGGARYRCVGAYHHQWCYGRLPLRAARRFMTLVKHKDNAAIVKDELRAMEAQDPDAKVPCPYSTFLVASAFCVDLEPPVFEASGVAFSNSVLPATMGSADGANKEGITVFDITDPTNPSYCFVSTVGLDCQVRVPKRVPLSAEQYARAYYPVSNENKTYDNEEEAERARLIEENVQETIDTLRGERLMTLDVLAEAWPHEYMHPKSPPAVDDTARVSDLPNLAELSLGPAVEYSLQDADTGELEGLVWLPGKAASIRVILARQKPFPDSGLSLLARVIEDDATSDKTSMDISGLSLSDDQIISLLASSENTHLEFLNLSHNSSITINGLRRILSGSKLRRLTLLNTSISNDDILQLLSKEPELFYTLEALVHPVFLSWPKPAELPNNFSYMSVTKFRSACASLIDLLGPMVDDENPVAAHEMVGSTLVPQVAFSSGVRAEGHSWGQRHVHCFPALTQKPFQASKWIFAANFGLQVLNPAAARFGFVYVPPTQQEEVEFKGLGEFLEAMVADGRPPPSESAVEKLEEILTAWEAKGAKPWSLEDFKPFVSMFFTMVRMRNFC
ncbi:hypothetical protein FB45DRAFT_1054961 [Roridomyces roridus]|uniref:Uncharacterized protein n=1 Tax=Roridomyces roridus TaxID=1738132 RepID=A0AAD7FUJ9_9AGAR|nr:hypothetical protein FB45DRAFT_1054961 [Roridomyces roridus]